MITYLIPTIPTISFLSNIFLQEFGDSARARKLYIDDESEEEEELEPNPKLGAGLSITMTMRMMTTIMRRRRRKSLNPIQSLGQASKAMMMRTTTMTMMMTTGRRRRRKRMINATVMMVVGIDTKYDDLIIEWYREDPKKSIYIYLG